MESSAITPEADVTLDADSAPDCHYDAAAMARGDSAYERLHDRIHACYGRAVQRVQFEGATLDRLTALGMLAKMDDRERRHRLFLAIDTIWRSMNGDDGPSSPYREYLKLSAARWQANGSPVDASARALGIDPAQMERWLVVGARRMAHEHSRLDDRAVGLALRRRRGEPGARRSHPARQPHRVSTRNTITTSAPMSRRSTCTMI